MPGVVRRGRLGQRYCLEEIPSMLRQMRIAALVALAAIGSFTLATAQEPKATTGDRLLGVEYALAASRPAIVSDG